MHVPCLLSLPPLFVKLLCNKKKALMPHEVWQVIKTILESQGLTQECVNACTFIMDWCVVAPQATGADKDSFLAFGLNKVMEQDNNVSLATWLDPQLNVTLGCWPDQGGYQELARNPQPQSGSSPGRLGRALPSGINILSHSAGTQRHPLVGTRPQNQTTLCIAWMMCAWSWRTVGSRTPKTGRSSG